MLEKIFVIHWCCGQRGKGNRRRFPATDLGVRLGVKVWLLDLRSNKRDEVWFHLQSTCCPGGNST